MHAHNMKEIGSSVNENALDAWNTEIGDDCAKLHVTLAVFLAERLLFLADNTFGHPQGMTHEHWVEGLKGAGLAFADYAKFKSIENGGVQMELFGHESIKDHVSDRSALWDVKRALQWVHDYFEHLWS